MELSRSVVADGSIITACDLAEPVPWWSFTKTVIVAGALAFVRDGRFDLGSITAKTRTENPWATSVLLECTRADKLRFGPGSDWSYSNIGYLFVRQLFEATCGESLGAALKQLVLVLRSKALG